MRGKAVLVIYVRVLGKSTRTRTWRSFIPTGSAHYINTEHSCKKNIEQKVPYTPHIPVVGPNSPPQRSHPLTARPRVVPTTRYNTGPFFLHLVIVVFSQSKVIVVISVGQTIFTWLVYVELKHPMTNWSFPLEDWAKGCRWYFHNNWFRFILQIS